MHTTVITLDHLARAFMARLGMPPDEAEANAEHVLDIFGFDSEILDNVLAPEDRQLFYTMETHGLVTTKSEENQLWHGQDWRTHMWHMKADRVLDAAGRAVAAAASPAFGDADVYRDLPASCWSRR